MQLGNAVKGYYGSESINSIEYLRRFIDIEYTLPAPSTELFCDYMYNYYGFADFFFSKLRKNSPSLINDKEIFLKIAFLLFSQDGSTLRQQEKIFAHARLVLNMVGEENYLHPDLFFFLIYIRDLHKAFYIKIRNKNLQLQQLLDELKTIFPKNLNKYDLRTSISLEAKLIRFYENYIKLTNEPSNLFSMNDRGENVLTLMSSFETSEANKLLFDQLKSHEHTNILEVTIDTLLDRIDLLKNFLNDLA